MNNYFNAKNLIQYISLKKYKIIYWLIAFILLGLLLEVFSVINMIENSMEFSNIFTPLATILAAFIYYFTLIELKHQNVKTEEKFNFDIYREKIQRVHKDLFEINFGQISIPPYNEIYKDINILSNQCNGISYFIVVNAIRRALWDDEKYWEQMENDKINSNPSTNNSYNILLFYYVGSIIRPLILFYTNLDFIVRDIISSKLDTFKKNELIELIKNLVLKDYLDLFIPAYSSPRHPERIYRYGEFATSVSKINPEMKKGSDVYVLSRSLSFSEFGFDNLFCLLGENGYLSEEQYDFKSYEKTNLTNTK